MGLDNLGQGKWMKAVYSITIFLLMPLKADDFVYMWGKHFRPSNLHSCVQSREQGGNLREGPNSDFVLGSKQFQD